MRRVFRHVLVLTIAVALVASTGAWRQCAALQMAAAAANGEHVHGMAHHADAAGRGGHDHHAMHHDSAANEPTAPAADHDCMKCCTMCVMANALLPAMASVAFTASAEKFFPPHKTWSGSILPVDPGIPKHIG